MPVILILLVPVLARLPAWLAGLRESPIWAASGLVLPGAHQPLPGLPGFLDLNAGWTTQALGALAARQWLAGDIPWWDAFTGIGMPLAAEMQSSALFLPYILLLALPGGTTLLAIALQWTAGLATWRLLRRLGLDQRAAVVGAVLFELCASFAWMGPPAGLPVAFLPLFLLGLERARAGGWRLITIAVALSLYAGFPETAYLDGLLALLWAVVRWLGLRSARGGFALRVAGGGLAGLLLAAPVLWPFFDLLSQANLGQRDGMRMSQLAIPPEGIVQLLTPYALGLPAGLSGGDPTGTLVWLWGRAGGFLGPALALAALLGAGAPGRDRVLRWVLLGWTGLLLARTTGVPGAALLFQAVPFHDEMQVFRYAGAAWLLPCCILAAYAVAQVRRGWRVWPVAALLLFAGGLAAWVAWPLARQVPGAPVYFAISLAWGAASLAVAAAAFARGGGTAATVLVVDSMLLFMVPLAAGHRAARLDLPAIGFLQANLGQQRFATLGPLQPNYGAAFGLASVNHNYLPSPAAWSDWVLANLRPGGDPVLFIGNFPPDEPGRKTNAAVLAENVQAYAGLGVRYVLAPPGPSPFNPAQPPPGPREAFTLGDGDALSGRIAAAPAGIAAVSVTIGTFAGRATGTLEAELCASGRCVQGKAALESAVDNDDLRIELAQPAPAGEGLSWTLRHRGSHAVAVWRWLGAEGPQPHLTLHEAPAPGAPAAVYPARVYADAAVSIYELPGAAPYLSTLGGPCTLAPQSRILLDADCDAPATLVRRELMLPGWRVRVGELDLAPGREGPLFQAVPLPAGRSRVAFRYRPPGAPVFAGLFALGVLALLPWSWLARPLRRPLARG